MQGLSMTQQSTIAAAERNGSSAESPTLRVGPAGPPGPSPRRRRVSLAIFGTVVLAVAAIGSWMYISGLNVEETDDAFIAGNVYQVAPRIAGRLKTVLVKDNEMVTAGQLLAEIDPGDQQASADQARAALALAKAQYEQAQVQVDLIDASTTAAVAQAQAEVAAAEAKLEQERAGLDSAKAESERAQADLERYSKLSEQAVSRQRLDVVRSTAISAASAVRAAEKAVASGEADHAAAQSKLAAAQADRKRVEAARADVRRWEAETKKAEAALHQAELSLSYTQITAPASGRVTNKAAEPGDYVREGRTLLSIVPDDVWVIANFKETQLRSMRPGQRATVRVDAYGIDLKGHLDSIQAGSGAQFSLLPPQNATGNYVKVVQRVPVKILFDEPAEVTGRLLGPGMSVVPKVYTK
jgi:membrane fusion protein (multidrug efflux system)